MLLNCGTRKDSLESLGLQGDQTSQSERINHEYSLERLMLKLKLQNRGHLMQRVDSLEKTQLLGKIKRQKEKRVAEDEMIGWHHQLSS